MKLLIVDDSFTMRSMLIRALRENGVEGDVRQAGDGLEALAMVNKDPPELVICDFSMPKLDGLKFVLAVRQRFTTQQVKIIMLTAKSTQATKDSAIHAGVDKFLAKPFVGEEIARYVRDLLSQRA